MKKRSHQIYRNAIFAAALLSFAWLACAELARAQSSLPAASAVATPKAYVSLQPVPRESTFEIGVVVGIMQGFHMNAHKVSEDYLIPTNLTVKPPAGIKELQTQYPEGKNLKLSFSDKPLSVYTKQFTVRAKFSMSATAPLGKMSLPFTLQYQACNDSACLPPVKIPVIAKIDVAPAGTKAHAMSPDIFSGKPK
ncbi:MAG TPA: protein-disulfide reductase DsbD domain-containing protein [Candidatus Acidoferrales bacterium]|nr:protein-disulfide reductase DsbD domain-containing protein [Candidatus Acidoferrales bacterium]